MPLDKPLRFRPLFRRYLWGGRKLATLLHKPIGSDDCAESWELVDHGADQSVVAGGPCDGQTLHQLVVDQGADLFGRHAPQANFPLLFKFLDANDRLSVQVHPNDAQAARLDPPDRGKTEAWVVLAAEPGAKLYAGLKRGFDRPAVEREIARGTMELCLHTLEPRPGDCIFLPAGVVHALGSGLVIAEIQQASDTTYRLFDWNRVGKDGRPRELHIRQGLEVIDFSAGPIVPQTPQPTERPQVERLVACDKFVLDRWRLEQPQTLGGDQRFHILAVLAGQATLAGDPLATPLDAGQVILLPAAAGPVAVTPNGPATLLDMYLP